MCRGGDIPKVRAVLRAHLYEDKQAEETASLKLDERQKLEALELMDATSTKTQDLIAKATTKHAAELAGLSPRGKLATMTTPVYLLHGQAVQHYSECRDVVDGQRASE